MTVAVTVTVKNTFASNKDGIKSLSKVYTANMRLLSIICILFDNASRPKYRTVSELSATINMSEMINTSVVCAAFNFVYYSKFAIYTEVHQHLVCI